MTWRHRGPDHPRLALFSHHARRTAGLHRDLHLVGVLGAERNYRRPRVDAEPGLVAARPRSRRNGWTVAESARIDADFPRAEDGVEVHRLASLKTRGDHFRHPTQPATASTRKGVNGCQPHSPTWPLEPGGS